MDDRIVDLPLSGIRKLPERLQASYSRLHSRRITGRILADAREFLSGEIEQHGILQVNERINRLMAPMIRNHQHEEVVRIARTIRALGDQRLALSAGWILLYGNEQVQHEAERALKRFGPDARFAGTALRTLLEPQRSLIQKKRALSIISNMGPKHSHDFFNAVLGTLAHHNHWRFYPEIHHTLESMRHGAFERLIEDAAKKRGWRAPKK
ncbi:hypothetical protein KJ765_04180 [Candidatus Micrarchaeota archaeon]|nr:hypothetical protein [Candidatus Micrarchaeota archaeon]